MGIIIRARMNFDPVLLHLDKFINKGMLVGAKKVAEGIRDDSRKLLEGAVKAHDGVWTGNLANSINVMSGDMGLKSFARYDVVIDTNRAPYAEWVEFGRFAGDGLPYSKAGGKDYRKSKFTGHRYMRDAIKKYEEGGRATKIVAKEILKSILSKKSRSILRRF